MLIHCNKQSLSWRFARLGDSLSQRTRLPDTKRAATLRQALMDRSGFGDGQEAANRTLFLLPWTETTAIMEQRLWPRFIRIPIRPSTNWAENGSRARANRTDAGMAVEN